jgi:hypothetical protein
MEPGLAMPALCQAISGMLLPSNLQKIIFKMNYLAIIKIFI